jgi:hypothetical protein
MAAGGSDARDGERGGRVTRSRIPVRPAGRSRQRVAFSAGRGKVHDVGRRKARELAA